MLAVLLSCQEKSVAGDRTPVIVQYKTVVFEAAASKTTVDDEGAVKWERGDEISIYYINSSGSPVEALATVGDEAETASLEVQIPETDNPSEYYAAFPKGSGLLSVKDGKAVFSINVDASKCDGTFRSANFAAAYTDAASMTLEFVNAAGMLCLDLPDGAVVSHGESNYPVSGIYVRSRGTGLPLNGVLTTEVSGGRISGFSESSSQVYVQSGELSAEALSSGKVYIPVTQVSFTDGLCIRYLSSGGPIPAALTSSVTIGRSHIVPVPDMSSGIVWDYYADSQDALQTIQNECLDRAKTSIIGSLLLDGTTLHLSHNLRYNLEHPLTFHSGKSHSYSMTVEGNGAILDGNSKTGVLSVGDNLHLTFRNLSVSHGSAENGAGLAVALTSSATDLSFSLDFEDCVFASNVALQNGGAIYCTGSSKGGLIRFNRCSFTSNNTATAGSGGVVYCVSGNPAFMFDRCYFSWGTAATGGTTIHLSDNASHNIRLGMNNCTVNAGNWYTTPEGVAILSTGYTVIANSTIWSSKTTGMTGSVSLGSNKAEKSLLINSLIKNSSATVGEVSYDYPALYVDGNSRQRVEYCLYSDLLEVNGAKSSGDSPTWSLSRSFDFGGDLEGKDELSVCGVKTELNTYSWTYSDKIKTGFVCPTLSYVSSAIQAVPGVGDVFHRWLSSRNSLSFDICGNARDEAASCPGSYQHPDAPRQPATSGSYLKLMSFNILRADLGGEGHTWPSRKEAAIAMIRKNSPSLMGLQECAEPQRKDILAADSRLAAVGVSVYGATSGYDKISSNPIIYRTDLMQVLDWGTFWLSDTPDEVSYTWAASKPRTCTWAHLKMNVTGEEFYYFNAHLHNGSTAEIIENRAKSIKLIISRMRRHNKESLPLLFSGDLNAKMTTESFVPLGDYGLENARTACEETDRGRTLNSFGPNATSVIDHIYFKGCEGSRFYVDRAAYKGVEYVSDHYPVFCELIINHK